MTGNFITCCGLGIWSERFSAQKRKPPCLNLRLTRNVVNGCYSSDISSWKMAARATLPPASGSLGSTSHDINDCLPVTLSANAVPFFPLSSEGLELCSVSDAGVQFAHCASKLRSLRAGDPSSLKTELNLLFDQLISENYNRNFNPNANIRPEVHYRFI